MRRKAILFLMVGVLALGMTAPAVADKMPKVPKKVQIIDPPGDANFLNDFGSDESGTPHVGEHATPADASADGDILAVWFTHDEATISAHIQVESLTGSTPVTFMVRANPGEGIFASNSVGCVRFRAFVTGSVALAEPTGGSADTYVQDLCNTYFAEAAVTTVELKDGTGLVTITAPRMALPDFDDGGRLVKPTALTRQPIGRPGVATFSPLLDNTVQGSTYKIGRGSR